MTRKKVEIERFEIGEYIMEAELVQGWKGDQVDFYISKAGYGMKSYMFGWPLDQTEAFEPKQYTYEEAIDLGLVNFSDYIELYEQELEDLEAGCYAREEEE